MSGRGINKTMSRCFHAMLAIARQSSALTVVQPATPGQSADIESTHESASSCVRIQQRLDALSLVRNSPSLPTPSDLTNKSMTPHKPRSRVVANVHRPCRDIEAGTFIAAFKGNASGPGCLSRLGRDYVVAAQTSRSALHFWTWHKVPASGFVAIRVLATQAAPCAVQF